MKATCPIAAKFFHDEALAKISKFWRYYDHDDDGIPQRTT